MEFIGHQRWHQFNVVCKFKIKTFKYKIKFFFSKDIDETVQDRMNKRIEKVKKLALNSSLMKDLQKQYSEAPEEVIVIDLFSLINI